MHHESSLESFWCSPTIAQRMHRAGLHSEPHWPGTLDTNASSPTAPGFIWVYSVGAAGSCFSVATSLEQDAADGPLMGRGQGSISKM